MTLNPITTNSKPNDTQKLAFLIRNTSPREIDIASEIKKDLKNGIYNNAKNTIDFYNVKTDIVLPKRLLPIGCPKTYKSVHLLNDTKAKKVVVDRFKDPEYNKMEREIIAEIRQDQGKFCLLSDLYRELSKGNELESAPKGSKSIKSSPKPVKDEIREVEDLDYWTQAKLNRVRVGQDSQVEELRKEIARMILFLEEDSVTQGDKTAVDTIFNEMDASGKKSSVILPSISGGDTSKGSEKFKNLKSSSGLIRGKGKEVMSVERKASGGMCNSIMMDSIDFNTSAKMGLKSQLVYYRGLHEPVEKQLVKQIESIEGEIEKKRQEIVLFTMEAEGISEKTKEIKRNIDSMVVKKKNNGGTRPSVTFLPGLVVSEEAYQKEMEEKHRLRMLRDELGQQGDLLKGRGRVISKLENECESLKKKQNVFRRIQVKLNFKILRQGLDCKEEGLVWVVKILLKEGENITYDDLPEFLDHTSKTHIMQKSKLLNQLAELKVIEKSLVNSYKTSFQGNFCNSKFNNIVAIHTKKARETAASLTTLSKTPNRRERKAHTLNEVDYSRNSKNTSLNELELELEALDSKYEGAFETSDMSSGEKGKTTSLAYIQEEKDEEEPSFERSPNGKKYVSVNEIRSCKKNLNENLYKEAKNVIRQFCLKKSSPVSHRQSPIEYFEDSSRLEEVNKSASTNTTTVKEEHIARIQTIQSEISNILHKIREDDQSEGIRIVKGYDARRARVDLDFYLTCVLGLAQAEKLTTRFALKKSQI